MRRTRLLHPHELLPGALAATASTMIGIEMAQARGAGTGIEPAAGRASRGQGSQGRGEGGVVGRQV